MFGTLKPRRCSLDEASQREHARFYCGLCKTLGSEFGQTLRVTLSNDAVFMALLADALLYKGAPQASYRCPMVPVSHRPAVAHDSPAMRYAGAVQILLGDQWLADRAMGASVINCYSGGQKLFPARGAWRPARHHPRDRVDAY